MLEAYSGTIPDTAFVVVARIVRKSGGGGSL